MHTDIGSHLHRFLHSLTKAFTQAVRRTANSAKRTDSRNEIQRTMRCADLPDLYCLYSQSIHIQINGTTAQKSLRHHNHVLLRIKFRQFPINWTKFSALINYRNNV